MIWILIWVITNNGGSMTSGAIEFNTPEACEVAKAKLNELPVFKVRWDNFSECVPKG